MSHNSVTSVWSQYVESSSSYTTLQTSLIGLDVIENVDTASLEIRGLGSGTNDVGSSSSNDDSDSSSSSKSSSSSSASSSSKSDKDDEKCTGSKAKCETGTDTTNAETIGLSIGIPCFVFFCILGFFFFRSYKKGKKEAESDNDPDFYGETTILPDYPQPGRKHDDAPNDDVSFYSNPFGNDSARYPQNILNNSDILNQSQNRAGSTNGTVKADPYYEPYKLPYQHTTGSHASLDEFAKEMGSEYPAYRITSRPNSPYTNRSANSSSLNITTTKNPKNLTEKTYSIEDPTTDSSTSYRESKVNTDNILDDSNDSPLDRDHSESVHSAPSSDDQYEDTHENLDPKSALPQSHQRQDSDVSYIDEPEMFNRQQVDQRRDIDEEEDTFSDSRALDIPSAPTQEQTQSLNVPAITTSTAPLKDGEEPEEEEDSEDIKRMRSVYKVYFDRENSVRRPSQGDALESDVPPLPKIDTNVHEPENVFEPEEANDSIGSLDPKQHNDSTTYLSAAPQLSNPDSSSNAKKHRAVSSIYSTIPLAQFDESQQPQQAYYPQQVYYPQQTPQHQIYQQPYYGQRQPPSPQISQRPYAPPQPLKPLQTVPSPSKIDYDSIVSGTDYAPSKSLTNSSKPQLSIKPFNPLHVSDQIFSPTSPISPSYQQFQQPSYKRDITPPSPHHIRQSIVMVDPVEIGKKTLYRPAGSFTQMQSANSSRKGSLTSQYAGGVPGSPGLGPGQYGQPPMQAAPFTSQTTYQSPSSEELPRSGSKADLRNQLGTSDNYRNINI